MITIVDSLRYNVQRRGKNLRVILDHARKTPVDVVRIDSLETPAGYPVSFYFDNRDFVTVPFADWRVALTWLRARRSWGITRLSVPAHMWERAADLFRGTRTFVHNSG